MLFWLLSPASIIWALVYYGLTMGSAASATVGMRAMAIEIRTWYGAPAYFLLGAVHAIVYWVSVSVLTPFILLVGLFNARRRLLHDMLVGTVLINNPARAATLRARLRRWSVDPKKPALGLDPRVETGFPPSRNPLRRAKEGRIRSCSNKDTQPMIRIGSWVDSPT